MEQISDKKSWQEVMNEIYNSMPESETFDPEVADKQIESLMELVIVLGNALVDQEESLIKLTKAIKENLLDESEESVKKLPPVDIYT